MRSQRPGWRVRARVLAVGILALALLAVSGSWADPPEDGVGPRTGGYPADCPGRLHPENPSPEAPPELVRFYVPPYGFIWGYPYLEMPQRAPAMPPSPGYRAQ
ncbi:MAG: hypothetical protein ACYSUF_15060, partial [Planctomycetota bacterium]